MCTKNADVKVYMPVLPEDTEARGVVEETVTGQIITDGVYSEPSHLRLEVRKCPEMRCTKIFETQYYVSTVVS